MLAHIADEDVLRDDLQARRGRAHRDGRARLRLAPEAARRRHALEGQDGQLRDRLRPVGLRPGRPPADRAGRGAGVHRPLPRALPAVAQFMADAVSRRPSTATSRRCSAAAARSPSCARATGRRASSASAWRSTRSSRAPRPTSSRSPWCAATTRCAPRPAHAHHPADPRRAAVRGAADGGRARARDRRARDGRGGRARPAAGGRRRHRAQLAGGEVVPLVCPRRRRVVPRHVVGPRGGHVAITAHDRAPIPRDRENDYTPDAATGAAGVPARADGRRSSTSRSYSFEPRRCRATSSTSPASRRCRSASPGRCWSTASTPSGEFYVPLATAEGTLVASYNRGMKLLHAAGGVKTTVLDDRMQRAPASSSRARARRARFGEWLAEHFDDIKAAAEATTRSGRLHDIEQYSASRMLFTRFNYTTGDAAGQNLTGKATQAACAGSSRTTRRSSSSSSSPTSRPTRRARRSTCCARAASASWPRR